MVNGSMGYFTDPYKWGIPWDYNPLIRTIDPNFLGQDFAINVQEQGSINATHFGGTKQ